MSAENTRVGLVGCGRLAELGYAPAFDLAEGVELVAVSDPDEQRRSLIAGELPAFATAEEMLERARLDAIVVASPPEAHEEAASAASAAGVSALIEKPPAPDLAGALRMASLDPPPFVGFNRRFSTGAGVAGSLAGGGTIEVTLHYRRRSWAPLSVRDAALTDLAPHAIDLALLAGLRPPYQVRARSASHDRIELEVESDSAHAEIGCACDKPHRERVTVRGGSGEVVFERKAGGLVRGSLARFTPGPHPLVASLAAQLTQLGLASRGVETPLLATAADGARVMELVELASEALASDGATTSSRPIAPETP